MLQWVIQYLQRYVGLSVNREPSVHVLIKLYPHNEYRDVQLFISPKIKNCLVSLSSLNHRFFLKVTQSFENNEIVVFIVFSSCHVFKPEKHLRTEIIFWIDGASQTTSKKERISYRKLRPGSYSLWRQNMFH